MVKEVNNTVGKLLAVHHLEAQSIALSGTKASLSWFHLETVTETIKEIYENITKLFNQ